MQFTRLNSSVADQCDRGNQFKQCAGFELFSGSLTVLFLIVAFCGTAAIAQAQEPFTAESNHRPIAIPDEDADVAIESSVFVPADLIIQDVNVAVEIEHPNISDLEIDLFSPNGERARLADEICDDGDADFDGTVFDDNAADEIGSVCPPGNGTFRPDDDLEEFNEDFSGGVWTLVVRDTDDDNVGRLIGWTLMLDGTFASEPIFSSRGMVSSASFLGGAVAPGEIVSIFGTALGPAQGMTAVGDETTQSLPTDFGGVQVFFDDTAAPLFFVSSNQINLQVPFEVAGREETTVRVEFEDTGTSSLTVPVLASGPAIFTLNGRGQGHATAVNPNGSVNDPFNPVSPGETVSVFATGLGSVEPSVPTGQRAPQDPLSEVVEEVTALVGDAPAEVTFAGLAPGFIGLYQVNIVVPSDTEPGRIVPIALNVGENDIENLTWISVGE